VALAFPLHPPGRPERSRADELLGADRPTLVVQGARDPFGTPDEVRAALAAAGSGSVAEASVVGVPAADHGFKVPRSAPCTQAEAEELVVEAVARALVGWWPRGRLAEG
jgi:predicted alpha/beta-hydrolase family hydrolase